MLNANIKKSLLSTSDIVEKLAEYCKNQTANYQELENINARLFYNLVILRHFMESLKNIATSDSSNILDASITISFHELTINFKHLFDSIISFLKVHNQGNQNATSLQIQIQNIRCVLLIVKHDFFNTAEQLFSEAGKLFKTELLLRQNSYSEFIPTHTSEIETDLCKFGLKFIENPSDSAVKESLEEIINKLSDTEQENETVKLIHETFILTERLVTLNLNNETQLQHEINSVQSQLESITFYLKEKLHSPLNPAVKKELALSKDICETGLILISDPTNQSLNHSFLNSIEQLSHLNINNELTKLANEIYIYTKNAAALTNAIQEEIEDNRKNKNDSYIKKNMDAVIPLIFRNTNEERNTPAINLPTVSVPNPEASEGSNDTETTNESSTIITRSTIKSQDFNIKFTDTEINQTDVEIKQIECFGKKLISTIRGSIDNYVSFYKTNPYKYRVERSEEPNKHYNIFSSYLKIEHRLREKLKIISQLEAKVLNKLRSNDVFFLEMLATLSKLVDVSKDIEKIIKHEACTLPYSKKYSFQGFNYSSINEAVVIYIKTITQFARSSKLIMGCSEQKRISDVKIALEIKSKSINKLIEEITCTIENSLETYSILAEYNDEVFPSKEWKFSSFGSFRPRHVTACYVDVIARLNDKLSLLRNLCVTAISPEDILKHESPINQYINLITHIITIFTNEAYPLPYCRMEDTNVKNKVNQIAIDLSQKKKLLITELCSLFQNLVNHNQRINNNYIYSVPSHDTSRTSSDIQDKVISTYLIIKSCIKAYTDIRRNHPYVYDGNHTKVHLAYTIVSATLNDQFQILDKFKMQIECDGVRLDSLQEPTSPTNQFIQLTQDMLRTLELEAQQIVYGQNIDKNNNAWTFVVNLSNALKSLQSEVNKYKLNTQHPSLSANNSSILSFINGMDNLQHIVISCISTYSIIVKRNPYYSRGISDGYYSWTSAAQPSYSMVTRRLAEKFSLLERINAQIKQICITSTTLFFFSSLANRFIQLADEINNIFILEAKPLPYNEARFKCYKQTLSTANDIKNLSDSINKTNNILKEILFKTLTNLVQHLKENSPTTSMSDSKYEALKLHNGTESLLNNGIYVGKGFSDVFNTFNQTLLDTKQSIENCAWSLEYYRVRSIYEDVAEAITFYSNIIKLISEKYALLETLIPKIFQQSIFSDKFLCATSPAIQFFETVISINEIIYEAKVQGSNIIKRNEIVKPQENIGVYIADLEKKIRAAHMAHNNQKDRLRFAEIESQPESSNNLQRTP